MKVLLFCLSLASIIILAGCPVPVIETGSWNMPIFSNGANPVYGHFHLEEPVKNDVATISSITVNLVDGVKCYHIDNIYPNSWHSFDGGVIYFTFGDIAPGTGSYPKDGHALSARFETPEKLVGVLKLAVYGHITNSVNFTANYDSTDPVSPIETDWFLKPMPETDVVPENGHYVFETTVSNQVFQVTGFDVSNGHLVLNGNPNIKDDIVISNGTFFFEHGDVLPGQGNFPKEEYAITGSFIDTHQTTGTIKLGTYGQITTTANFIAHLVP